MKNTVLLSIRGQQTYQNQEPDTIELVTEGTLEFRDGGWDISYEETSLTGLEGVTTTFRVEPDRIVLTRTGKLNSQMIFREGEVHDSLYQMEFGALMISVMASTIRANINKDGGTVDLLYAIEIENSASGTVDYHLDIQARN